MPNLFALTFAGQQLKSVAVPRSLSLAWRLGSAVAQAQHAKHDAAEAIAAAGGGQVLFRGGGVVKGPYSVWATV